MDHARTYFELANTYKNRGDMERAIYYYQKVLDIVPDSANTYLNMGNAFKVLGQTDKAVSCYRKVLEMHPEDTGAWINIGLAFKERGMNREALCCYERAIEISPGEAKAYTLAGDIFRDLGQLEKAFSWYQTALRLRPDLPKAHIDIGGICFQQEKFEEARLCCEKALSLKPDYVEALYNLAITLEALGRVKEAMEMYTRVLTLDPRHRDAALNRSLCLLLTGNFDDGWREYENRIVPDEWKNVYPYRYNLPRWDGSPLEGKKIFVHDEQGIGDTIQFVRYLPMVKSLGATVILETRKSLFGLFQNFHGIDRLVERRVSGDPVEACDCYIPLLSLPGIFGTRPDSIPASVPYLFADAQKANHWHNRLSGPEFKTGLVWRGNPRHKKDRSRSCALQHFEQLSMLTGLKIFGLQKMDSAAVNKELSGRTWIKNLGREFRDFTDTAAVIANLDLVVSVDTAVAHLAGAMGKPVWLLLPFVPDWRWMTKREDSPWYPSMRLFRQPQRGVWASVVENVRRALKRLLDSSPEAVAPETMNKWTFDEHAEDREAICF